jgi:hypothetical protein
VGTVGERGILTNLFVVILMAAALIGLIISAALETRRSERIQRSVVEKINSALEDQFNTLGEQRTLLAKDKWSELVRYFMIDHVRPLLSQEERVFFHKNFAAVALAVERAVKAVDPKVGGSASDSRSEVEAVAAP